MLLVKSNIVTVSPKYQVTIPVEIRERLNIQPGSKMVMQATNGHISLLPLLPPKAHCGIASDRKDTDIPVDPDRF